MLSSYVKSAFKEIPTSEATDKQLLIDFNGTSNFRLFSVHFIPVTHPVSGAATRYSGINIFKGDPDSGGESIFRNDAYTTDYSSGLGPIYTLLSPVLVHSNGIYASEAPSIYVQGTGVGIRFASVTYQA